MTFENERRANEAARKVNENACENVMGFLKRK